MRVLAFTSNRADYDLLSPLYRLLHEDENIDFRLCVSGAHLSTDYGQSVRQIRADDFTILIELETLLAYDSNKSKLKSASLFLQNSIDLVSQFAPDVILFAGDREDVVPIALLGVYLHIPSVHFYGGDHERAGHEDTMVRHAASKLATVHFVSCQQHAERLRAMGEAQSRIFNIGSVALDKFRRFIPLDRSTLLTEFRVPEEQPYALVIYHPSPDQTENDLADMVMEDILSTLIERNFFAFVSSPNSDAGNKKILQCLTRYSSHPQVVSFKNLDRKAFLSLFYNAKFMIGNSSAGILEAASIPLPVINVGHRQAERFCAHNVVFCHYDRSSIEQAVERVCSKGFTEQLRGIVNPMGDGQSAQRAYELIKTLPLQQLLVKIP